MKLPWPCSRSGCPAALCSLQRPSPPCQPPCLLRITRAQVHGWGPGPVVLPGSSSLLHSALAWASSSGSPPCPPSCCGPSWRLAVHSPEQQSLPLRPPGPLGPERFVQTPLGCRRPLRSCPHKTRGPSSPPALAPPTAMASCCSPGPPPRPDSFSAGSGPVPTRSGAVRGVSAPLLSEQAWSVLCLACWGRCAEGPHRSESGHREPLRLAGTSQGALAQLRLCVAAGALLAEQPAFSGGLLVVLPGTEGREPVILS